MRGFHSVASSVLQKNKKHPAVLGGRRSVTTMKYMATPRSLPMQGQKLAYTSAPENTHTSKMLICVKECKQIVALPHCVGFKPV